MQSAFAAPWHQQATCSALQSHVEYHHCSEMKQTNKQQQQSFYGPLSGTTRLSRYQKKHSPTHHPDHHPMFLSFFHLLRSIASSLFKLCAWQSFHLTSLHAPFWSPLGLEPSTSYSIHLKWRKQVVKVIWHKSTSQRTRTVHHSIVFARWRQCANM